VERVDYIANPQSTGYRAIHLLIRLPFSVGTESRIIGCEIQVRSLLQNSWAELSRADIYTKEETIAPTLLRLMERLAQLLEVADAIANDIRDEISKRSQAEIKGKPIEPAKLPGGATKDQITLAFLSKLQDLYKQEFNQDAAAYLVEAAANEIGEDRKRLERLEKALGDRRLLKRLRATYKHRTEWDADDAQVFRWVAHAATHGLQQAIEMVRKEAKQDRANVDEFTRREMLSDLPSDWHELVDHLEHPPKDEDVDADVERWASALDTVGECGICGTAIIGADGFAEAVVEHYGLEGDDADEARERIDRAVFSSGVEVGGGGGLCSYHADAMRKSD
jgi:hypothetical protein